MAVVCLKCLGNKKIRDIGCMIVKCKTCNGTGKIDVVTEGNKLSVKNKKDMANAKEEKAKERSSTQRDKLEN